MISPIFHGSYDEMSKQIKDAINQASLKRLAQQTSRNQSEQASKLLKRKSDESSSESRLMSSVITSYAETLTDVTSYLANAEVTKLKTTENIIKSEDFGRSSVEEPDR